MLKFKLGCYSSRSCFLSPHPKPESVNKVVVSSQRRHAAVDRVGEGWGDVSIEQEKVCAPSRWHALP